MKQKIKRKAAYRLAPFSVAVLFAVLVLPFPAHAGFVGDAFYAGIQYLLYGVFELVSFLVNIAATIFGWAINPDFFSGPNGFFNLPATYAMWKFVRDFLNLFFILGLLFAAFATVFQVSKYSLTQNKSLLIKILIAALLVNFSFPISRALIDITNVPMYFFAKSLLGEGGNPGDAFSDAFSALALESILIPNVTQASLTHLLAAIVFEFIFGITLLVLAVQFIIRLVALLILVVLSPVGFVMSAVPGLQSFGSKWWQNFFRYAFFGPAAMFMLVLATHFFAAIGGQGGQTYQNFQQTAGSTATGDNLGFVASMAMFSIPIVILWFTIGLSGKFAVAGGGAVTKWGEGAIKKTGRGLRKVAVSPVKSYAKGAKEGVKKGAYEGKLLGFNYGETKFGKFATGQYYKEAVEKAGARTRGFTRGGSKGVGKEMESIHNKNVAAREKEFEDSRRSNSDLRNIYSQPMKNSREDVEAAVNVMKKREGFTDFADFQKALAALEEKANDTKNATIISSAAEKRKDLIRKVDKKLIQNSGQFMEALTALQDDQKAVGELIDKAGGDAFKLSPAEYQSIVSSPELSKYRGAIDSKLKKEGKTSVLVEHTAATGKISIDQAVRMTLRDIGTGDVAKQELFRDRKYQQAANDYLNGLKTTNPERYQKIKADLS